MSDDDELIKHMTKLIATGLDRCDALTAERNAAYASGYSDAETEISKSALGQKVDFLHSQYAKYESAWMAAEGKLADAEALIEAQAKDHASNNIRFAEAEHRAKTAEAERDRLRAAIMFWLEAEEPDVDAAINMMRAALKGETP